MSSGHLVFHIFSFHFWSHLILHPRFLGRCTLSLNGSVRWGLVKRMEEEDGISKETTVYANVRNQKSSRPWAAKPRLERPVEPGL